MGMELTYRSLGGLNYEYTLNFYRDCNSAWPAPGSVNMNIRSTSCGINTTTNLALVSGPLDITPLCPTETSNCSGGTNPGVEQYVYQGTFTLPAACADYIFSYELANRNSIITNLVAPDTERLYVEATLDNTAGANSSPIFTTLPVPYICVNQPVVYANGSIDADGDSLRYSLVNALGAGGNPIAYNPPYSATYPVLTSSGTFPFDNATGTMSFTPNALQACAIALRIDEYRAGVLIGSVMRDVQVIVVTCGANNQPAIDAPGIINLVGGTLIDGNSVEVCAGVHLSFDVIGSDADATDVLDITSNLALAIPGASFTTTGTNPVTGTFSWTPPTNGDVGFKPFTLTVEDDYCPIIARQTFPFDIRVLRSTYAGEDSTICGGGLDSTQLNATGGTVYSWSPTTGLSNPNIANPWAKPTVTTTYTVTTDYVGVCFSSDQVTVTVTAPSGPITGADSVCTNATEAYSVPLNAGSTYAWTITGGAIASGAGTNAITVDWGATGMVGQVDVVETPSCNVGPISLPVNIHALPTSGITGSAVVAINTPGEPYSVVSRPGYTYTWTITGGTVASGAGTSSITVDWGGTPGAGNVQVVASNGCGSAAPINLAVNIYDVIESIATGNWNNGGTWDCGCNPPNGASVRINDGHVVSLTNNERCNNLIITTLGTLNNNGNRMRVNGNYDIDGVHNTDNQRTQLRAASAGLQISGTGVVTNIRDFRIRDNNYTIPAGTNLTFNCSPDREVRIYDNITVTNLGTITIFGDLDDRSGVSTWRNGTGGVFNISDELFVRNGWGNLDASAVDNTVEYNGTINQTIKTPVSSYYHLNATGSATKSPVADLDINGNVLIDNTATIDVSGGFDVFLAGNWTNIGSTFTPGGRTVTFDGTGVQIMTNTGLETYNDVVILPGSSVQIPPGSNASVANFLTNSGTLDNDGRIILANGYSGNTGTLRGDGIHELSGGNWDNSTGTFLYDLSTVLFSGAAAQTIQGTTTFYNLTLDNASGASVIGGSQNMVNAMTLNNGTFSTNNAVTFLSTAAATGFLAEIQPGADIIGDITMQRYINSAQTSWRFMSSAVTGRTLSDWNDDIITSGFTGSDYPTFPFINIYRYTEAPAGLKDNALSYIPASNITDPILDNEGYWVYVGPVPLTFDVTGPASKFGESLNVTYNPSGSPIDDGWCLVPNPYPCAIDWDSPTGWTKTAVDDACYIWNPNNQQYAAYIAGVGTNGGSRYIPSQVGFYVHTNAAGPVLNTTEQVKSGVTANQGTYRSAADSSMIRLELSSTSGWFDETVLRFIDGAMDNFESQYDAYKLASVETNAPWLSTVTAGLDFAINSLDELTNDRVIPLRAMVGVSGTYEIAATDLSGLPASSCIILEDLLTGTMTDLRAVPDYSFTIPDTTTAARFLLHIGAPIQFEGISVTCAGDTDGSAIALGAGGGPWDYEWVDASGNVISSTMGATVADTLTNLAPGPYTVTVTGSGLCGTVSEIVVVPSVGALASGISANMISCYGESDGSLVANPTGGTAPYLYSWSTGSTSATALGLSSGTHVVTITDSHGCSMVDSLLVTEPSPISVTTVTAYSTDPTSCDGTAVLTINGGTPAYSTIWDAATGGQTGEMVTSLCPGTYSFMLEDQNGCIFQDSVTIYAATTVNEPEHIFDITIQPNPSDGDFQLSFNLASEENIEIALFDISGRIIYNKKYDNVTGKFSTEMAVNTATGIYTLQVKTTTGQWTRKVSIR